MTSPENDTSPCQGSPLGSESESDGAPSGDALTRARESSSGLVICVKTSRDLDWVGDFVDADALQHTLDRLKSDSYSEESLGAPGTATLELSPSLIRIRRHMSVEEHARRFQGKLNARQPITQWSARSRASMTARLATLDYSAMEWGADRPPALITLTYPGLWEHLVPTARDAKRHLQLFRKRYERKFGTLRGVWKLEFQRRGAPHFHIFCVPPGRELIPGKSFRCWLSEVWTQIVAPPDPVEREKHLRAGTGVDFAFGYKSTSEFQIAVYFSKHNSAALGWKEYQHKPPDVWLSSGSVGRFWGYWGLQPLISNVSLSLEESLFLARTLRRWARANQKPVRTRVWRTKTSTGEIRQRTVKRRRRRFAGSSGFLIVPDGKRMVEQLVHALGQCRGFHDSEANLCPQVGSTGQ
jgi:hypothetical protein